MKKIFLLYFSVLYLSGYECKYVDIFKKVGAKYNIDYRLLCSIGSVESNFNPFAKAERKNDFDIGLMQINSWWLPKLKKRGLYDVRILYYHPYNIDVGGWIMGECIKKFGVSTRAIDCYNKGDAKSSNDSIYIRKVLSRYYYFIKVYN